MPCYTCPRCNYKTDRLTNFRTHLNRKEVCVAVNTDVSIDQLRAKYNISMETASYSCKNCVKVYSSRSALAYHSNKCKFTPIAQKDTSHNNALQNETLRKVISLQHKLNTAIEQFMLYQEEICSPSSPINKHQDIHIHINVPL